MCAVKIPKGLQKEQDIIGGEKKKTLTFPGVPERKEGKKDLLTKTGTLKQGGFVANRVKRPESQQTGRDGKMRMNSRGEAPPSGMNDYQDEAD
ncbi:hypothetical protein [Phaffia rhodozyma]|uniref:Uncharacterized protein n=1 Tax=Phaffia rhodozyma TaxID=264483 RepID=A0A0F7SMM0_PHARH|nr:hypothetical protein [Phaffia rhodozyma]